MVVQYRTGYNVAPYGRAVDVERHAWGPAAIIEVLLPPSKGQHTVCYAREARQQKVELIGQPCVLLN